MAKEIKTKSPNTSPPTFATSSAASQRVQNTGLSNVTASLQTKAANRLASTPRRLTVDIRGDVAQALDQAVGRVPGLKRADVMRALLVEWLKGEGDLPQDFEY